MFKLHFKMLIDLSTSGNSVTRLVHIDLKDLQLYQKDIKKEKQK